MNNGRYHFEIKHIREETTNQLAPGVRKEYLRKLGMRAEASVIQHRLSPSIDIIRSFPPDPPHADCQGIARMAQNLLINYIISDKHHDAYAQAFAECPTPVGWTRIQNPIRHRGSWDLSEQTKAYVVTALVCRRWLQDRFMRPTFVGAMARWAPPGTRNPASSVVTMVFSEMAASYGIMTRYHLNAEERQAMPEMVVKARRAFLRLVEAAVRSRTKGKAAPSRRGSPAPSATGSIFDMQLPEDDDENGAENTAAEQTAADKVKDYTENMNTQLSGKQLIKWGKRSNVHVAKHYATTCDYYATMWNVNVLLGENYHRRFKTWVGSSNHKAVEKFLMRKDTRLRGIRFVLENTYALTHPVFTATMKELQSKCPGIMQHLLPPSRTLHSQPTGAHKVAGDRSHISPRMSGQMRRAEMAKKLLPGRPFEADSFTEVSAAILQAYRLDYDKPTLPDMGSNRIQYWKTLTFVDIHTEKRVSYHEGDYLQVQRPHQHPYRPRSTSPLPIFARIEYIATHALHEKERLFLICRSIGDTGTKDALSFLPLLSNSGDLCGVGLPAIDSHRPFILRTTAEEGHDAELMYCCWDVHYG